MSSAMDVGMDVDMDDDSVTSTANDTFNEKTEDFVEWLKANRIAMSEKIELVDLREQGAGRAVVATQDIAEDETLFEIPRTRILTPSTSALPSEVSNQLENDPWMSLILVMIFEAQHYESSQWSPYFDVMPAEFDTLMYWTDAELKALRGSAVVDKIGKASADKMFMEKIVPIVNRYRDEFEAHSLTDEDIVTLCHLFGSTIMAYAFDLEKPRDATNGNEGDEEEQENANWEEDSTSGEITPKGMIPLADMLNANADLNNAKLFHEDNAVVMKSIKAIAKGEQIYNDYGSLPRADVLRRYGYVTEEYAKYDVVEISTDLITDVAKNLPALDEKAIQSRLEYLDEQGVLDTAYDISRAESEDGPFPEELGVLLNALTTTKQDFEKMRKKEKLPKSELTKESLELLFSVLLQRRAKYGLSSIADDRAKLSSISSTDHKTRRLAMALQVVVGEKEVLQEAASKIESILGSAGRGKKRKAETFEDEARELAKKQKN